MMTTVIEEEMQTVSNMFFFSLNNDWMAEVKVSLVITVAFACIFRRRAFCAL
jgi:hypothetical protein